MKYLYEVVEPRGYCLNGYDKVKLFEVFKDLSLVSKETPTKKHLVRDKVIEDTCFSINEIKNSDQQREFIFEIDYRFGGSLDKLFETTIDFLTSTPNIIKLKINGADVGNLPTNEDKKILKNLQQNKNLSII